MATRTILVALTWDGHNLIATPTGTMCPNVLRKDDALTQLTELVNDTTIPEAKSAPTGFDVGDMFRGIGKVLADMGKPDEAPSNGGGQ